jgi:hypothetical protein
MTQQQMHDRALLAAALATDLSPEARAHVIPQYGRSVGFIEVLSVVADHASALVTEIERRSGSVQQWVDTHPGVGVWAYDLAEAWLARLGEGFDAGAVVTAAEQTFI